MIQITMNSEKVRHSFKRTNRKLESAMANIIRRYTIQTKKEVVKNAMILGNYPGGGALAKSITAHYTKKVGVVRPGPKQLIKTKLLEGGPKAVPGYPQVRYLGSPSNQKLREWAKSRLAGKAQGRITIGGVRTSFGKPSRQFMTNAKNTMRPRLKRIIKQEMKKIK